jgi:Lanthionine synthetase C-like protein
MREKSRRSFLQGAAACVPAAAGLSLSAGSVQAKATTPSPSYLFAAKETARWIQSAERVTPQGTLWLPEPDHPEKATTYFATPTLYTGTSGIVLFLIELGKATGDASYLDQARKGADHILATWQDVKTFQGVLQFKNSYLDFNHGLAGVAFSLYQSAIAFNDQRYRDGALAITKLIVDSAEPAGAGVEWIGNPSPVVGDGSLVLYLIWAAREFGNQSYLDLASRAENDSSKRPRWSRKARSNGMP